MVSSALRKYGSMPQSTPPTQNNTTVPPATTSTHPMTTGSQRQDLPVMVNERHMTKYDYKATDETKMSFLKDDVIQVYQKASTY
ncbi:hypothetical protein HDU77_004104 [Chytriomyces hyalinus]|nr:hypothetical protein HDU77_004104 [Chytriomyces hyalinus]